MQKLVEPGLEGIVQGNGAQRRQSFLNNDFAPMLERPKEMHDFLSNDRWWGDIHDDTEIPLSYLQGLDPFFGIVGKEREIYLGKLAVLKAAKQEIRRRGRQKDLSQLQLTVEYLRENGYRKEIDKRDNQLKRNAAYDWERAYNDILEGLQVTNTNLDLAAITEELIANKGKYDFSLRIDEQRILQKLKEEGLTNPVTLLFLGPMGSGKSLLQKSLQQWGNEAVLSPLGLNGYDRLLLRDPNNPASAFLRTLPGGEGDQIMQYYNDLELRKQSFKKNKTRFIYSIVLATPLYTAITFTYDIAQWSWGGSIGVNPLLDLGVTIRQNLNLIAYSVAGLSGYTVWQRIREKWSKGESQRPNHLVRHDEHQASIVGTVSAHKMVGSYDSNAGQDTPVQERVSSPELLRADAKLLKLEQLADLEFDTLNRIAEFIQEGELSIGERAEYTTSFVPLLWLVGLNPHLAEKVPAPLRDRLKLGYSAMVSNEVSLLASTSQGIHDVLIEEFQKLDPNSTVSVVGTQAPIQRDVKIERTYLAYLKLFRKDGKPFDRDAWQASLDLASLLAENRTQIVIDRETIGIHNAALTLSSLSSGKYTTAQHIFDAAKTTRTDQQSSMFTVLEQHYGALQNYLHAPGTVRVLGMLLYNGSETKNEHERHIAEKNSLGYVFPIRATVTDSKGIEIITSESLSTKAQYYRQELELLLNGINTEKGIRVDISKALSDDDTLLAGMYIAARSALDGKMLDTNKVLLAACDHEGNLYAPKRSNKRIMTAYGRLKEVVVSSDDIEKRINQKTFEKHFDGMKMQGKDSLASMYEAMKAHAP